MKDFVYKEEYQYFLSAYLNVTDDCNLQCRYCFVEQHPHYMTLDTAKKAADFLYNNLQKRKEIKDSYFKHASKCLLYFFGGEPTLCYDSIIVPLVEYCEKQYPNIFTFGITTNGTLLNKEKIDFFKEKDFSLLLSIDGDKETQDYNRPCKNGASSFELLKKNIPYLLQNFPNTCFRSTLYAPTISHLFENYLCAESLGFKQYEIIEDCRHNWTEKQKEQLKNEISKIYLHRLVQISNGIKPMESKRLTEFLITTIGVLDSNCDIYNVENNATLYRCGLGTVGASIGYDGNIYGCQEQTSRDKKNIFLIGNIFDKKVDIERHKKLLEFYYNNYILLKDKKEDCKSCMLNKFCKINGLLCPSTTYDLFNDMTSITDISCFLRQVFLKNSVLYINLLHQINKDDYLLNVLKERRNR